MLLQCETQHNVKESAKTHVKYELKNVYFLKSNYFHAGKILLGGYEA